MKIKSLAKRALALAMAFAMLAGEARFFPLASAYEDEPTGNEIITETPAPETEAGTPAPETEAGTSEIEPTSEFKDVSADSYYAKAVAWALANGVTKGTGDGTTFSPNEKCTRAQIVTFLFRFEKAAAGTGAFTDVPADSYYAGAVGWAVDNGVTNGAGKGMFSPENVCTRAQIVTFLYRDMNK